MRAHIRKEAGPRPWVCSIYDETNHLVVSTRWLTVQEAIEETEVIFDSLFKVRSEYRSIFTAALPFPHDTSVPEWRTAEEMRAGVPRFSEKLREMGGKL